jgi:hypothetical protein
MKRRDGFEKPLSPSLWGVCRLYSAHTLCQGDIFPYQLGCHFP